MIARLQGFRLWLLVAVATLGLICVLAWRVSHRGTSDRSQAHALAAEVRAKPPLYFLILRDSRVKGMVPRQLLARVQSASDSRIQRRLTAVTKLSGMGSNAWPVVPELLDVVCAKDLYAGYAASTVLANIEAYRHPDWQQIRQRLSGNPHAARVFHLFIIAPAYNLHGGLHRPVAWRKFGLMGLEATGSAFPNASDDLWQIARSGDEPNDIRELAVLALGHMGTPEHDVVPELLRVLANADEWPNVRGAAAIAAATGSQNHEQTRSSLKPFLLDDRALVRAGTARGLWKLGTPAEDLLPCLSELLNHKLISVRVAALEALTDMGPAAASLAPQVRQLLQHENAALRLASDVALRKMEQAR